MKPSRGEALDEDQVQDRRNHRTLRLFPAPFCSIRDLSQRQLWPPPHSVWPFLSPRPGPPVPPNGHENQSADKACFPLAIVIPLANRRTQSPLDCQASGSATRSEEHTSELQSRLHLVC